MPDLHFVVVVEYQPDVTAGLSYPDELLDPSLPRPIFYVDSSDQVKQLTGALNELIRLKHAPAKPKFSVLSGAAMGKSEVDAWKTHVDEIAHWVRRQPTWGGLGHERRDRRDLAYYSLAHRLCHRFEGESDTVMSPPSPSMVAWQKLLANTAAQGRTMAMLLHFLIEIGVKLQRIHRTSRL